MRKGIRLEWLRLSPLFLLYIITFLVLSNNELGGDQARYLSFANNILNGAYAMEGDVFLWNGPGYPLILALFSFFGFSIIALKSLNIVFLSIGILMFFKTCRSLFSLKESLVYSYALGLYYPNVIFSSQYLLTEGFVYMLSSCFLFIIFHFFKRPTQKNLFIASFLLSVIILTKVVFAYVISALAITSFFLFIFKKKRVFSMGVLKICLLAHLFTLPYLVYTFNLTGIIPYYSNAGGQCVYWLSTPYEGEQGEWIYASSAHFKSKPQYINHRKFLESIDSLDPVEKDEALKQKALAQIKNNPKKFLKNYISNISRLFIGIPNSYQFQEFSVIVIALPNSFLFVFLAISILLLIWYYKQLPWFILTNGYFVILYLGASSLLCAYPRMLFPILPSLFLSVIYTIRFWKTPKLPSNHSAN